MKFFITLVFVALISMVTANNHNENTMKKTFNNCDKNKAGQDVCKSCSPSKNVCAWRIGKIGADNIKWTAVCPRVNTKAKKDSEPGDSVCFKKGSTKYNEGLAAVKKYEKQMKEAGEALAALLIAGAGLGTAVLVGIVIAALVVCCLCILCIVCLVKHFKKNN